MGGAPTELGSYCCALSRGHGVVKLEELLHVRHLHGVADPLGDSHQRQPAAVLLMGHISAHQRADAGRVDVGNLGEVEDEGGRGVAPHHRLKRKEVGDEEQEPFRRNTRLPAGIPLSVFDLQRLLRHPHIVLRECEYCVKGRQLASQSSVKSPRAKARRWPHRSA